MVQRTPTGALGGEKKLISKKKKYAFIHQNSVVKKTQFQALE